MNYFKPELLARVRSLDDEAAEAAAEELEGARRAYQSRLKAIRLSLPSAVRRLIATASLHDAKLLSLSLARRKPRFVLRLQLESTKGKPATVLELIYRPVVGPNGGVAFRRHAPATSGSGPYWVLYSEFDVDEDHGFFTHSLLLTGDLEIRVRFHSVQIQYLEEIISPLALKEEEHTWPLVEA